MFGAPQIMGLLSECSRGVQLKLLYRTLTVRLQTKQGVMIDHWLVTNAEEAFDFHPGIHLKAGMDVEAVQ